MIVFLTRDLMIFSSASSAARSQDRRVVQVNQLGQVLKMLETETVELILVDLQTPGLEIGEWQSHIAKGDSTPRMIAFAQHVEVDL